ncbi:MAG: DUF3488 domain-containing protein [Planctomycetota bacterium]|nr:MAG: DUF3488 domain-containing protein [Planctomycetota bacterium]
MTVSHAYRLSIHLLAAVSMAALATAEGSAFALFLALALPWLAYLRSDRPVSRRSTAAWSVAALLVGPLDYLAASGDPMIAAAHLLMAVQFVKLFGPNRARDHLQILAISLMHIGVAAVMTIDLQFSVWFTVYAIVATWTLILFCIERELQRAAPDALPAARIGARAPLAGIVLAAGMLATTGLTFLVFPRFSAVLLRIQRPGATQRISGFSTEMGLADIASIQQSDTKVMEVIVERRGADFPETPRWRGLAFDRYEGGRWRRSWGSSGFGALIRDVPAADRSLTTNSWVPVDPEADRPGGPATIYSVTLHPTGTDVLFAAPRVRRLAFLSARRPRFVRFTRGAALRAIGSLAHDVRYRVETVPVSRARARTAAVVADGRIDGTDYLALEDTGLDRERLHALATRIASEAHAHSPYDRARALERYLRAHYTYSLEMQPPPPDRDPVEFFLYERRSGHCELFASAFVLLCRSLGLPARLVNGFSSGEWNEIGGFWQVRQRDAHAWAEVHFADVGWLAFDPTPDAGADEEQGGWFASVGRLYDYLRLRWLNHVIGYSLADQMDFADRLRKHARSASERARSLTSALRRRLPELGLPRPDLRLLALLGLGLALAAAAIVAIRRRRRARRRHADERALVARLRTLLDRLGYPSRPSDTARELAERARALGPEPEEIAALYYLARYGRRPLAPAQRRRIAEALAALERRARTRGAGQAGAARPGA